MPDAVGPTKFPKKKLDDHIPRRRRDFNNGIAKVGVVYFDKQVGASHAVRWSKSFSNLNCYTNLTSQELVLLNLDWMVEIFFFFFFVGLPHGSIPIEEYPGDSTVLMSKHFISNSP